MTNRSHSITRQAWADRIDRFEQAGQTIRDFCAAEGVSTASFYQWRRKLRSDAPGNQPLAKFLPVRLQQCPPVIPATVVSVELPGGVRVRFEVTADEAVRS